MPLPKKPDAPVAHQQREKPLLLIVDDQLQNTAVLEKMLAKYPLEIQCVDNSKDVIQVMSETQPDLVLLDMSMPDVDGYRLLNLIQVNANICHIPVVLILPNLSSQHQMANHRLVRSREILVKPIDPDALKHLIALFLFVSKGRLEVARMHNQNSAVIDMKNEGLLGLNREGRIIYVNNSATRLLRARPSQLIGLYVESIFEELNRSVTSLWHEHPVNQLCVENKTILQVDHANFWCCDGESIAVKFAAVPVMDAKDVRIVLAFRRIASSERKMTAINEASSQRDPLTGLMRRTDFVMMLKKLIQRAHKGNQNLSVFHIDVDHFANINDSIGHDLGDELLASLSARLKGVLDGHDGLGRLGSDEFAIAMIGLNGQQGEAALAYKILTMLNKPFLISGHELHVTVSIGIASFPQAGNEAFALIEHAEIATRRCKAIGRNNYHFFNVIDNQELTKRLKLEVEFQEAFRHKQLNVVYYPVTHLGDHATEIFSVNVCWHHPQRGKLRLSEFHDMADELGLLMDLTLWTIETTLKQVDRDLRNTQWRQRVKLAFAVSPTVLLDDAFLTRLRCVLASCAFDAAQLILEVPERYAFVRTAKIYQRGYDMPPGQAFMTPDESLKKLQQLGVQMAVTDFGADCGPLNLVTLSGFHYVKFSSAYLRNVCEKPTGIVFLEGLVALLKSQGIVPWVAGREVLQTLGCAYTFRWSDLCTEAALEGTLENLTFTEVLELRNHSRSEQDDVGLGV